MLGWVCKGIGINLKRVEPYLDKEKCLSFLKETLDGRDIQGVIAGDGGEFRIASFVDGDFYDGLGELFSFGDDTCILSYGNNNGDSFLFYAPAYPWEFNKDELALEERDVYERITDTVLKFCSGLSRDSVEAMIGDICYFRNF